MYIAPPGSDYSADNSERIKKLDRHEGSVKGVCWDPVGNYLATQVSWLLFRRYFDFSFHSSPFLFFREHCLTFSIILYRHYAVISDLVYLFQTEELVSNDAYPFLKLDFISILFSQPFLLMGLYWQRPPFHLLASMYT